MEMSALQHLARAILLSRTFHVHGLPSLWLFSIVLCFAFSWVQPCRQKRDWQKVSGGQDLLNFSSCIKSSLLLSADPLSRAGIQICLMICCSISERWESKGCVPQKFSHTPLCVAGWVDTAVFFAGVSYPVEHGCLQDFIHLISFHH